MEKGRRDELSSSNPSNPGTQEESLEEARGWIRCGKELENALPGEAMACYRRGANVLDGMLAVSGPATASERALWATERSAALDAAERLDRAQGSLFSGPRISSARRAAAAAQAAASHAVPTPLSWADFESSTPSSSSSRPPSSQSTSSRAAAIIPSATTQQQPVSPATHQPTPAPSNPANPSAAIQSQRPSLQPMNRLKGIERKYIEAILNEVVDEKPSVGWDDVVGLESVKQQLNEMVVLPMVRPDLFRGIRAPARGLLLFGPPGNGKTMIARALAAESSARFFSISAATLTSKYVGDGEKMVRALFSVALEVQPSVIFIDEVDSLLTARSESEHEASRRLKTEFLVQFDGLSSSPDDLFIVIGATNRPQELDEAARRRFSRRIYVRLPDAKARTVIVQTLLRNIPHALTLADIQGLAGRTDAYSASDLTELCRDAAMQPVRELGTQIRNVPLNQIRPVDRSDFDRALRRVRPSVSPDSLKQFEDWNRTYGHVD